MQCRLPRPVRADRLPEGSRWQHAGPIYLFEDGNLISEINIGADLGLEGFTHIHNAVFRVVEGADGSRKFFILAYAWNPGDFVILEQVD